MKASDIMKSDVTTLSPTASIQEIARTFRERGIGGAPVADAESGGRVIGIVTEVDLIARHARPHLPRFLPLLDARIPLGSQREYREILRRILATTAREIMTTPVKTVDADADLEEVATLMVEGKANPVPVLRDGVLIGIIRHSDLIAHLEEATAPADEG